MRPAKTILLLIGSLFVVVLGALVLLVVTSRPTTPPPLPDPNGYDDLLKAAEALVASTPNFRDLTHTELAAFVSENNRSYEWTASALSRESRVPPLTDTQAVTQHMAQIASLKGLALALAAKAKLTLDEKRYLDAVQTSLDGVQFSHAVTRGGVMMDGLVAVACEAIAMDEKIFGQAILQLDAKSARESAKRLAELDARAPTAKEILSNEHEFSRRTGGVRFALIRSLLRLRGKDPLAPAIAKFEQKMIAQQTRRGEWILRIASHAFSLEKGHPPENAQALVPDYLKSLPKDPITGNALPLP